MFALVTVVVPAAVAVTINAVVFFTPLISQGAPNQDPLFGYTTLSVSMCDVNFDTCVSFTLFFSPGPPPPPILLFIEMLLRVFATLCQVHTLGHVNPKSHARGASKPAKEQRMLLLKQIFTSLHLLFLPPPPPSFSPRKSSVSRRHRRLHRRDRRRSSLRFVRSSRSSAFSRDKIFEE